MRKARMKEQRAHKMVKRQAAESSKASIWLVSQDFWEENDTSISCSDPGCWKSRFFLRSTHMLSFFYRDFND